MWRGIIAARARDRHTDVRSRAMRGSGRPARAGRARPSRSGREAPKSTGIIIGAKAKGESGMFEMILGWLAIALGGASGACWIKAASINTPLPMAYLSGPPQDVVQSIRDQSWWNGIAAWLAAAAVLAQALASAIHKLSC